MKTSEGQAVITHKQPGCLVQVLWFALIGWWAGQAWAAVAWILCVTIIGMPLGVMMLNNLPKIIALRDPSDVMVMQRCERMIVHELPQVNIVLRALYFLLIGWWLSLMWIELAFVVSLTIIGLPLGFWMFDRVPGLVSLKR
jgi:uncharacterized membrane protein YccF (DUF307 family)